MPWKENHLLVTKAVWVCVHARTRLSVYFCVSVYLCVCVYVSMSVCLLNSLQWGEKLGVIDCLPVQENEHKLSPPTLGNSMLAL